MEQIVSRKIEIKAHANSVWQFLTQPELQKRWMGEPEMQLAILTDWRVGSNLIIKGFHHAHFENKGKVLAAEPGKQLTYTHLSSLSNLNDKEENYTVLDFRLEEKEGATVLTLTITNFPTESIYKHFQFYWGATLQLLKHCIESNNLL